MDGFNGLVQPEREPSQDELVQLAEGEVREQMLRIAHSAGFESVSDVLDRFNLDGGGNENYNARLNSGGTDATAAFRELTDRLQASDTSRAQAKSDGFSSHSEFVEGSQMAADARARGERDRGLELRIGNTDPDVIAGRGQ